MHVCGRDQCKAGKKYLPRKSQLPSKLILAEKISAQLRLPLLVGVIVSHVMPPLGSLLNVIVNSV